MIFRDRRDQRFRVGSARNVDPRDQQRPAAAPMDVNLFFTSKTGSSRQR